MTLIVRRVSPVHGLLRAARPARSLRCRRVDDADASPSLLGLAIARPGRRSRRPRLGRHTLVEAGVRELREETAIEIVGDQPQLPRILENAVATGRRARA